MTIQRLEHVGIVVDDLAPRQRCSSSSGSSRKARGRSSAVGWTASVGLEGARAAFAMLETPDGDGRLELVKFHAPSGLGADRD